ncbi:MAG: hypothetical protein WA937_02120 [Flavobacteriales bacterium]
MNTAKRTLLTALIAAAAIAGFAQEQVTFKGTVIAMGTAPGPVNVCLTVDGLPQDLRIRANGNFLFTAQEGQQVRMISSCEGFVTKEVVIDVAHLSDGTAKNRSVKFDVQLSRKRVAAEQCQPEAAGNIAFGTGTGRVLVNYDNRLAQR